MSLKSITVAVPLCLVISLLLGAGTLPAQEEHSPADRRRLALLDKAVAELREELTCPTCIGSGVNEVPTPARRVRRGEPETRDVLCGTCLGTGLAVRRRIQRRIRSVAMRLKRLYPGTLAEERAREVELTIFQAQALVSQTALMERLRAELSRSGLWTLDVRERAVMASADPIRLDVSAQVPKLARDLDRAVRRLALPVVFEETKAVELPEAVRFEALTLRAMDEVTDAFRASIAAYLRRRHTPEDLIAASQAASQPASQPAGAGETPEEAE